jgi:hypothetical protein
MLLGVLVDVIGAVASTEKQKIEITFIAAGAVTQPFLQRWGPIHGDIMAILVENMIMNHWEFGGLHKTIKQTDFSYGYSYP